jgi:hypothetical protein
LRLLPAGPLLADVDGGGIECVLEMRRVEFLDHLDAGAAVLRNLIDVGAFHEAHADVGVAKAVGGAPVPVAVELEFGPSQNAVEQLDVIPRKDMIGRLWIFDLFRQGGVAGLASAAAPRLPCASPGSGRASKRS